MNPELQRIIEQARAAIARGVDPGAVDAKIAELSGGRYPTFRELTLATSVEPAEEAKRLKAESEALDHSAVSNKLRMFTHGATMRFSDELAGVGAALVPGGKGYTEARDQSRARIKALRDAAPGMSGIMEAAGALTTPGLGIAKAGGGLVGAATGALEGATAAELYATGDKEGNAVDRVKAAGILPPAIGAAFGVALPVAKSVKAAYVEHGASGQGARVANALEQHTGLSGDVNAARSEVSQKIADIRQQYYRPLEEAYSEIQEKEILEALSHPDVARYLPRSVQRNERLPGYGDIQGKGALLDKLRKAARNDPAMSQRIEEIEQALSKLPGHDEANAAYHGAAIIERALKNGEKFWGKSSADIERALQGLSPAEQTAFRQAQVYRATTALRQREEGSVALLRQMLDAGEESRKAFRQMFPDDASFAQFRTVLRTEKSAEKVRRAFENAVKLTGVGVGGGMAYGGIRALFGGGWNDLMP